LGENNFDGQIIIKKIDKEGSFGYDLLTMQKKRFLAGTNFFREVWEEAGKVNWLSRQEAFRYVLIVVGVSFVVALILGSFDYFLVEMLRRFVF